MPFLYSISRTDPRRGQPHHAQKPSSGRDIGACQCCSENDPGNIVFSAHNRTFSNPMIGACLRKRRTFRFKSIRHNVSDHSLIRPKGAPLLQATNPVRTMDRTTGFSHIHEFPHGQTSITRVQRRNRT